MKQLSLRAKLYILIMTVLIPLLILQLVNLLTRYETAMENELQASKDYADTLSISFTHHFQYLWNAELAIGNHLINSKYSFTPEDIDKYLRQFLNLHPVIREFSWISPDGQVIANTYSNTAKNTQDSDYYQHIISGEEIHISDLYTTNSGELSIASARGIKRNGNLVGIIVAYIDIDKIGMLLPSQKRNDTVSFGLIDSQGKIIYQNTNLGLTIEQRDIPEDSPAWLSLQGQPVTSQDYNGQGRIGASVPINGFGWAAFTTTSVNEVLEGARADTNRDIIVLMLIGIIITLVYGLLIGDHFLKPLMRLQKAALAISKGDLTARANLEGNDELATTGKIFDQMADRIQHLEVSRTRFLQTAAHELRNPMAGIKGILSLILRRFQTGKPLTDMTNMFEIMEREIDRLSDLLNQILEAFRTQRENGMLTLDLKRVNLLDIIDSAMKPFQISKSCKLITDSNIDKTIWILGDFIRLEEVFRNLLSNAIKYSPDDSEVFVTVQVEEDHALVTVQDHGIGIPKEQLEGIFECFYRASNLEKRDPGGMGLGLYICKEIIDSHVGSIWAESEEGVGSTFYVKLPLY